LTAFVLKNFHTQAHGLARRLVEVLCWPAEDLLRPPLAVVPPAPLALHDLVERLAEPSLHMNVSPSQCDTPPFDPEHGCRPLAMAAPQAKSKATAKIEAFVFLMINPFSFNQPSCPL
jgi:hypothetical protein